MLVILDSNGKAWRLYVELLDRDHDEELIAGSNAVWYATRELGGEGHRAKVEEAVELGWHVTRRVARSNEGDLMEVAL